MSPTTPDQGSIVRDDARRANSGTESPPPAEAFVVAWAQYGVDLPVDLAHLNTRTQDGSLGVGPNEIFVPWQLVGNGGAHA